MSKILQIIKNENVHKATIDESVTLPTINFKKIEYTHVTP